MVSIDPSGYQNESSQAACMRYVGARFIQVCGRELPMRKHAGKLSGALMSCVSLVVVVENG